MRPRSETLRIPHPETIVRQRYVPDRGDNPEPAEHHLTGRREKAESKLDRRGAIRQLGRSRSGAERLPATRPAWGRLPAFADAFLQSHKAFVNDRLQRWPKRARRNSGEGRGVWTASEAVNKGVRGGGA